MMNSFGNIYRFTTFGESHGPAIGGVIDGMPAGVTIDIDEIQQALDRRRPGSGNNVSQRRESDRVNILSGLLGNVTTGAPIGFVIYNEDAHPADYEAFADAYRPSHADYTWQMKYGLRDHRGGGRASARETACRVVAGAVAMQVLRAQGITIHARAERIGDTTTTEDMAREIESAMKDGDTVGGIVACTVSGVPAGIGEPVYGKLHAMLGSAMLSINAAKGVEFGMGFEGCCKRGSEVADYFAPGEDGKIEITPNHSGGIQGGISNGNDIILRVAFKPAPTMMREVETVDRDGRRVTLPARGRHDACVVPRAVPVVEAMAACVILDAMLLNQSTRLQR